MIGIPVSQRVFQCLLLIAVLLNATALFSDILEPDGALYAAISKRIALTGDWVNLYGDGHDWLDKPHLPFWLAALSFRFLGISAFAYKLPAFVCWLAGLYYTWRLALALYGRAVAQLATLIYATALHAILANVDVRAEAYLTAFVVAAIYYLYRADEAGKRWLYLLAGSFCCALAVMTKGVFVLITIGAGLAVYQLFTRQWKWFLLYWWVVLALTLVFILPELYCLYEQFDKHPEKLVFNRTGVSGIRFFFWDSQFGRFFNSGPIKGEGDVFFFLHTVLWAFLPWSIFLYVTVVQLLRKKIPFQPRHWVAAGGALVSFLLFSLSSFQLPHYIVIVFPQLAMLTAAWLVSLSTPKAIARVNGIITGLLVLLVVLMLGLAVISRMGNTFLQITWILVGAIVALLVYRKPGITQVAIKGTAFAVLLFVFMNLLFYPPLMHYQAGMQAGKWLQQHGAGSKAVLFRCNIYSFEMYAPAIPERASDMQQLDSLCAATPGADWYMLVPQSEVTALQSNTLHIQKVASFGSFHISQLTGGFINAATRAQQLEYFYLYRVMAAK